MTIENENLMNKIEERVSVILNTSTPKEDLQVMYKLQREHAPGPLVTRRVLALRSIGSSQLHRRQDEKQDSLVV